ncbi:MarR family winged helix-turn-helix transcriptional regulator [Aquipuribacter hungaricus]|uniref:MarR family winged helix-turn-helix transcriptional regulator n=1 Tax=Aquipuribacter hungaricus TaxID=545624 RepID=A0ABV7WKS8_9MICO
MTQTRWLDDDEQRAWRALAGVVLRLPTALDAQLARDSGLTHFSYYVLAMLSEAPERTLAMSTLARNANSSQSRLSHAVSRLERSGWVARRPCPGNGRVTLATLTDEGFEKVREAAPGHAAEVVRLVVDDLDAEQVRVLGEACERVLARLDGDCPAEQGPPDGTMAPCTPPTTTSSSSAAATTA